MVKIFTIEHTFPHPWEQVVTAIWKKYPNPHNPAVVGMDVIDREVVDGVLHSHRLVSSKWGFPSWVQSIIGSANVCYASEKSQVHPSLRQMILRTVNITFCNHVAVDEKLSYVPHPEDKNKTILKHEAVVKVDGVSFSGYMEDILKNKISANASKGREAMEWVIANINQEVIDVAKSRDDLLLQTKKSIDEMTNTAKKSMDDISQKAKQSFDDIQGFNANF